MTPMKKLILDLDAIDVESFPTGTTGEKPGTVHAHITLQCSEDTCDNCNTTDCDSKNFTCTCPTVIGLTCEYPTCGQCNPTDPNCTTYCR